MKVCCISDLHGILPTNIDACDVVCICGDISPLKMQSNMPQMRKWVIKEFIPWCESLPCDKVLVIAGNHDGYLANKSADFKELLPSKVKYLEDEEYVHIAEDGRNIKFYGTPWCKIFGNWWFMVSPEKLTELYQKIPTDVDILLTHDAPYGSSDTCFEEMWWNTQEHIGNMQLMEAIVEKGPKYCIHGHLHSSNHLEELLADTVVRNCSIVNEHYQDYYVPIYLEI